MFSLRCNYFGIAELFLISRVDQTQITRFQQYFQVSERRTSSLVSGLAPYSLNYMQILILYDMTYLDICLTLIFRRSEYDRFKIKQ